MTIRGSPHHSNPFLNFFYSSFRGDPDKADYFGNTALHLAAARGHEFCVRFLVKFGCNIWSLDIDRHSARELAAINGREKILQFLDLAQADQELNNRKKSKILKEKAEKDAEKRYYYQILNNYYFFYIFINSNPYKFNCFNMKFLKINLNGFI